MTSLSFLSELWSVKCNDSTLGRFLYTGITHYAAVKWLDRHSDGALLALNTLTSISKLDFCGHVPSDVNLIRARLPHSQLEFVIYTIDSFCNAPIVEPERADKNFLKMLKETYQLLKGKLDDVTAVASGLEAMNTKDDGEEYPLHAACLANDFKTVEHLIVNMARDPNQVNKEGKAPLHLLRSDKNLAIAELLLFYGADINQKCDGGKTPLYIACEQASSTHLALRYLDHPAVDAHVIGPAKMTQLHVACRTGLAPVVKKLIHRSDIGMHAMDERGLLAFTFACCYGHVDVLKEFFECQSIERRHLIGMINTSDNNNRSSIFLAAQAGEFAVVRLLLSIPGVNTSLKTKSPEDPNIEGFDARMIAGITSPKIAKLIKDYRDAGLDTIDLDAFS